MHVLRSRKCVLAGVEGLEEVHVGGNRDDDELRLTASWRFQGVRNDPENPI